MSLYGVTYYKREGYLPGASRAPNNANQIDPDKDAFSTAPHDEYAPVHNIDDHDHNAIHEAHDTSIPTYGGPSSNSHFGDSSYGGGMGYVSPAVHDDNTSYTGYSGESSAPAYSTQPPSIVGYSGSVGSAAGRAQFPHAAYN
jgi:hypothetical protein